MKPSYVFLLFGVLFFTSCTRVDFTYYLENSSDYTIDSAAMNVGHQFHLEPGEIAGPFKASHSGNLASLFSEPLLTLFVGTFSDADSTYRNKYGCVRDLRPIVDKGTYVFDIDDVARDSAGVDFKISIRALPVAVNDREEAELLAHD